MEEIINLAIEDPLVRLVLARFDLEYYLSSKYRERDLFLATNKALDSIENEKVHNLWSGVLLGRLSEFPWEATWLYTVNCFSDSDFGVGGIQYARQIADSVDYNPESYINLYDVDKFHSYFRELRMSLRFVNIQIMKRSSLPF